MYRLLRAIGFRMDAERAHHWALKMANSRRLALPWWLRYRKLSHDPVELFGLTFPNRVGLAAGYDKDGWAWRALTRYGFGHIEVGTVTPSPQSGHPRPRVWRYPEHRSLINRMGFPSAGVEVVRPRLGGDRPAGVVVGASIGPNASTSRSARVEDYRHLVRSLGSVADYLAVNVSSPNTEGLRDLQDGVGVVVEACLTARATTTPILVKLSPDLRDPAPVARAAEDAGAHGLIVSNTTISRPGFDTPTPEGGLSGAPLGPLALQTLERVRAATTLPLIASGGIMTVEDAQRRLDAGASLVQLYTGLVYEGPKLVRRIAKTVRA